MSLVRRRSSQMAYVPPAPPTGNCLCITASEDEVPVYGLIEGELSKTIDIKYSYDQVTWTDLPVAESGSEEWEYVTLNEGESIYLKGNNPNGLSESFEATFSLMVTGSAEASGNIMSLIDDGACTTTVIPNEMCFMMFFVNSGITTPPELPATTLTMGCYAYMFFGSSLEEPPELPATTLAEACYTGMFYNSALQEATSLPATTLKDMCYAMMFASTSVTTVPELPATTLAEDCYSSMFAFCSNLQVSDTQTADTPYAWTIPTSGVFTNTYAQGEMFRNCAGTRSSSDMAGVAGQSYTYYTQNPPVS